MTNDLNLISVDTVDVQSLSLYQHEKAQIDMQIATAKAFPRDLKNCIKNAETVIELNLETAESCCYSLVKGGKEIKGAGINLAKIIASEWGNMRIENRIIGYDATHVSVEAIAFDLEKNFAFRSTIKKSIVGSRGRYSEDMAVIAGNAANSIALRNVIFTVVGRPVVDHLYNVAKKVITGDVSTQKKLDNRKKKLFDGFIKQFKDKNLTQEELVKYCKKETYEEIDAEDIVSLIGLGNSIKDNQISFEEAFRPSVKGQPAQPVEPKQEENQRLLDAISNCPSKAGLEKLQKELVTQEHRDAYDKKYKELS